MRSTRSGCRGSTRGVLPRQGRALLVSSGSSKSCSRSSRPCCSPFRCRAGVPCARGTRRDCGTRRGRHVLRNLVVGEQRARDPAAAPVPPGRRTRVARSGEGLAAWDRRRPGRATGWFGLLVRLRGDLSRDRYRDLRHQCWKMGRWRPTDHLGGGPDPHLVSPAGGPGGPGRSGCSRHSRSSASPRPSSSGCGSPLMTCSCTTTSDCSTSTRRWRGSRSSRTASRSSRASPTCGLGPGRSWFDRLAGASVGGRGRLHRAHPHHRLDLGSPDWGAWWAWDPLLTTTALLFVLYLGYLVLRQVPGEPDQRARRSAIAASSRSSTSRSSTSRSTGGEPPPDAEHRQLCQPPDDVHGSMAWTLAPRIRLLYARVRRAPRPPHPSRRLEDAEDDEGLAFALAERRSEVGG